MKVLIVGATGAIGGEILQHVLRRNDITQVIALTRRPLPENNNININKLDNIIIQDFGDLAKVRDSTWEKLQDADALIWAMGTYSLNEAVNLNYPLSFQEHFAKRRFASPQKTWEEGMRKRSSSQEAKFRFILLSGAFVEPDQSRRLYFLWDQRRMKGLLQTRVIEFAEARGEDWEALVIRPGGVLFGGNTFWNKVTEFLFGGGLAIRGEELGAFVAELVVKGSQGAIIENLEMVERGRKLLREAV